MAYEKRLKPVPAQLFTADGTSRGRIEIPDACAFKVKQKVILTSNTQGVANFEVKRVESDTVLYVGPISDHQHNSKITDRSDISNYLVADAAAIYAEEQNRPNIPQQEIERLTYEEEPVVARRVVLVDSCGNLINENNPLPVNAVIDIGDLVVDLDAKDGSNIAISAHPAQIFTEAANTITTTGYQQIFSYTSTNINTKILYVTVSISTTSNVILKINGAVKREYRTSPADRNAHFRFYEHRSLPTGSVLTIEAEVERLILPTYSTFTALEGYIA